MSFDHWIKNRREEENLTQEALAIAAGVSRRTIQNAESGADVGHETVRAIKAVLEKSGEPYKDVSHLLQPASSEAEHRAARRDFYMGFAMLLLGLLLTAGHAAVFEWWPAQTFLFHLLKISGFGFGILGAGFLLKGSFAYRALRFDDDVDLERVLERERLLRESGAARKA